MDAQVQKVCSMKMWRDVSNPVTSMYSTTKQVVTRALIPWDDARAGADKTPIITTTFKIVCKRLKLHQRFLHSRRVQCGNRVKVSSITSFAESIKPDLHKEGPGQDTRQALFSSHLIRGVGHSNSTLMPSGWLCPALLSFLFHSQWWTSFQ